LHAKSTVIERAIMASELPQIRLTIGDEAFAARLRTDMAPFSCEVLAGILPLDCEVIHARWSGESIWAPLSRLWPAGLVLPTEHGTENPRPGDVLLFGGRISEPELLISYGRTRFASVAGPLAGNPVLTVCDGIERLPELGRTVLWRGAMRLQIARG
jgi:hypothetical protein